MDILVAQVIYQGPSPGCLSSGNWQSNFSYFTDVPRRTWHALLCFLSPGRRIVSYLWKSEASGVILRKPIQSSRVGLPQRNPTLCSPVLIDSLTHKSLLMPWVVLGARDIMMSKIKISPCSRIAGNNMTVWTEGLPGWHNLCVSKFPEGNVP